MMLIAWDFEKNAALEWKLFFPLASYIKKKQKQTKKDF